MRAHPVGAAVVSDMMIGPSRGYVGRRASQSVGCGGRNAYAHMRVGRGVAMVAVVMVVVRA